MLQALDPLGSGGSSPLEVSALGKFSGADETPPFATPMNLPSRDPEAHLIFANSATVLSIASLPSTDSESAGVSA